MRKAIIYDFDKTIYSRETSLAFMKYFLINNPKYIPLFLINCFKILFCLNDLKKVKNIFFSIFKNIDITSDIDNFWKSESNHFYDYFYEEIKNNKAIADVLILISASPDFLLNRIYKKLGFDILIATKYLNYNMLGKNCKGIEKLNRLKKIEPFEILAFYSDSLSDKPLFDIAQKKITINKGIKTDGLPKKNGLIDKWL